MAAVTWKNIAPSNPSGLLSAANQAAKSMGEGISGIGTALQSGVDNKVESDTNAFISDLMAAGSEEERNAMISAANDSFLNLDTVSKTNYELGAPERAKQVFEEQLAAEQFSKQELEKVKSGLRMDEWNNQVINPKPSTKTYKPKVIKDPFANGGFLDLTYGLDDSSSGLGTGFGPEDKIALAEKRKNFVAAFEGDITMDEFNQFVNEGNLTFDDRLSIPGRNDMFEFTYNDKEYDFDGSQESQDLLYEAIYKTIKKTDSTKVITRSQYYDDFTEANPDLSLAKAKELFDDIYDKNVKNKTGYDDTGEISKTLFGELTKDEANKDVSNQKFDDATYKIAARQAETFDDERVQELIEAYSKRGDANSRFEHALLEALQARVKSAR